MGKCLFLRKGETHTAPISGILANTLAVGSTVKLMENGVAAEYLVVHQGLPSSMYDASCDGCWLLRKYADLNLQSSWYSYNSNDYGNSLINKYLNETYIASLENNQIVKQVKIPYCQGGGYSGQDKSGENGLSVKAFILSSTELKLGASYVHINGTNLSYFDGTSSKLIYTNQSGSADAWWQRSPNSRDDDNAPAVTSTGGWESTQTIYRRYIRPALILPSTALFDKTTLILKGVA